MNGFVIAKPGADAFSHNITDDYVTTQAPILKVFDRGFGSVSFASGETNAQRDVRIPYQLDYRPLIQAFCERAPGSNMCLMQSTNQRAVSDLIAGISYVEDRVITLRFQSGASDPVGTYNYLYYIFSDDSDE